MTDAGGEMIAPRLREINAITHRVDLGDDEAAVQVSWHVTRRTMPMVMAIVMSLPMRDE
jgi:hypothetical protein